MLESAGELLLVDVLKVSLAMSLKIASLAVMVAAKDENADRF